MSKKKILLGLVFLFFLTTRIYKIASIPSSVYWDEASIGYNAYAVATDLKDEWGSFLPLHFRAFGEFKLPVYIYSVVPFVKTLGLNAYAVRIPAVLYTLGTLTVVYFLVKKITGKESLGLLSVFLISVSPWLFLFSRTGYEATAGLFFFLLGTYWFLFSGKRNIGILLGVAAFILSFYSYNSFRIIIPVWLIILGIYSLNKKTAAILIAGAVVFLVSLIPVYRLYKFDAGGARFSQVEAKSTTEIAKNYLVNFSPEFLFIKGDTNPRSQVPGHGELFWIDLPFIIFGVYEIFKRKKFVYFLPLISLLLAPIPTAITKESPHALRAILAAPSIAIISALGIGYFANKLKKYKNITLVLIVTVYLGFFGMYHYDFVSHFNSEAAVDWQYQYKEIFTKETSGTVTDEYGQPYIFALFYQKISPSEFRSTVKYNPVDKWGFSLVSSFNGFEFK